MLVMQGGDSLFGGLPIIHITYQQYIANPSAYHSPDVIVHISGFPTAGNLPADYVGYDSNLNMEDIGNIATKAIAKVEPSDTALYLHEVGTYFINKDGDMCKTDVEIAVNGTIALNTNCHVIPDGIANEAINNVAEIQITTPAAVGFATVNLPTGFTHTNSYVACVTSINRADTQSPVLPNSSGGVGCIFYLALSSNEQLVCHMTSADFANQTYKVLVIRYK